MKRVREALCEFVDGGGGYGFYTVFFFFSYFKSPFFFAALCFSPILILILVYHR